MRLYPPRHSMPKRSRAADSVQTREHSPSTERYHFHRPFSKRSIISSCLKTAGAVITNEAKERLRGKVQNESTRNCVTTRGFRFRGGCRRKVERHHVNPKRRRPGRLHIQSGRRDIERHHCGA